MSRGLGKMAVGHIAQEFSGSESSLRITGSGKKITLTLDRWSAGYLFGFLAAYLKREESEVASMRKNLALENR